MQVLGICMLLLEPAKHLNTHFGIYLPVKRIIILSNLPLKFKIILGSMELKFKLLENASQCGLGKPDPFWKPSRIRVGIQTVDPSIDPTHLPPLGHILVSQSRNHPDYEPRCGWMDEKQWYEAITIQNSVSPSPLKFIFLEDLTLKSDQWILNFRIQIHMENFFW